MSVVVVVVVAVVVVVLVVVVRSVVVAVEVTIAVGSTRIFVLFLNAAAAAVHSTGAICNWS